MIRRAFREFAKVADEGVWFQDWVHDYDALGTRNGDTFLGELFWPLAQRSLRMFLDSRPFVHGMLGSQSLSHDGVRFLHREGQFKADAPTCYVRGVVEPETLPEALEWLANVLARQIESTNHDTQVEVHEAVGYPLWVKNDQAEVLRRCDMGSVVQRTHHWSPLVAETEFLTTERDRALAIYDFPKDRHVFPWVEVNARFGVIKRKEEAPKKKRKRR